jgi:putative acetyltransferase
MTLDDQGEIDLAYVRPDRIGSGVGHGLYVEIERLAIGRGLGKLTTRASELARPFFERHGWQREATQREIRGSLALTNHAMTKRLTDLA